MTDKPILLEFSVSKTRCTCNRYCPDPIYQLYVGHSLIAESTHHDYYYSENEFVADILSKAIELGLKNDNQNI